MTLTFATQTEINYVSRVVSENEGLLEDLRSLISDDSFENFERVSDTWWNLDDDIENEICLFEIDTVTLEEILDNI